MTEPYKIPGELPTYHGICPYCASAVSCVTRDGMTYARCSHRGCGARGPYHQRLDRAVELFKRGRLSNAVMDVESPRPSIDMEPEPPDAGRCSCARRLGDYCPTTDDDCPQHGTGKARIGKGGSDA